MQILCSSHEMYMKIWNKYADYMQMMHNLCRFHVDFI